MKSFHRRSSRPRAEPERAPRSPAGQPAGKVRADVLMVEQRLATSRAQARALIESNRVRVVASGADKALDKPGHLLPCTARLTVVEEDGEQDAPALRKSTSHE
ncbi:MAG: S4 domain-containing protein [Rhodocyclaceae bacterium]